MTIVALRQWGRVQYLSPGGRGWHNDLGLLLLLVAILLLLLLGVGGCGVPEWGRVQYLSLEGGGGTMTWGCSVITGCRSFFGSVLPPKSGHHQQSVLVVPWKKVPQAKWSSRKSVHEARLVILQQSCTIQTPVRGFLGSPHLGSPHHLHPILIFDVKVHSLEQ